MTCVEHYRLRGIQRQHAHLLDISAQRNINQPCGVYFMSPKPFTSCACHMQRAFVRKVTREGRVGFHTGISMMLKCFRRRTSNSTLVPATMENCSVTTGEAEEALLPPLKNVRTPDSPKYSPLSNTVNTLRAVCATSNKKAHGYTVQAWRAMKQGKYSSRRPPCLRSRG